MTRGMTIDREQAITAITARGLWRYQAEEILAEVEALPSPITDEMVERACNAWFPNWNKGGWLDGAYQRRMRRSLEAAMNRDKP